MVVNALINAQKEVEKTILKQGEVLANDVPTIVEVVNQNPDLYPQLAEAVKKYEEILLLREALEEQPGNS